MKKRRVMSLLLAVFMLISIAVNAKEVKITAGYAAYNLEDNLFFGLTEEDIYVSTGVFDESTVHGATREILIDGGLGQSTPTGGRWLVYDNQAHGAHIIVNMGAYKTFDKFMMSTGLGEGVYRETNYNLYDFKMYYWDDYKWIEIPIPLDTDTDDPVVKVNFEPVTACKFKLVSNQSTAFRVQEIALFAPEVELEFDTYKVSSKVPETYDEITISGRNYQYDEFIPKRTYKREENKVICRPDMCTTFISSKEVENIFSATTVHNNSDESVDFTYKGKIINFKAGRKSYIKDGREVAMNVAPYMEGTIVFIPVRDLIHSFDYYMSWNDETGEIGIYDPKDMLLPTERDLDYMPEKGVYSPYKVEINGVEQTVWGACNNDFVHYVCDSIDEDNIVVKVTYDKPIETAEILPTSRGLKGTIDGNTFTFTAKCNDYLDVEINGDYRRPLFVFLKEPIAKPDASEKNVIVLDKDDVYEFTRLELPDDTTLYLGDNVVLLSNIIMHNVKNIKIIGNGIMISPYGANSFEPFISDNIHIEGVVLPAYRGWKIPIYGSSNVTIKNVIEFSTAIGGDGMDPFGVTNLTVDHMFTKLRDDAIAIKSGIKAAYQLPGVDFEKYKYNENINVSNCTYICMRTGNPLEIGFELNGSGGKVSNVKFSNIDIIRKGTDEREPNWRGGLTIHHSGSVDIENITYEDVRIERSDEGLMCVGYFYVPTYLWDGMTPRSGINIKNITFKNISYTGEAPAPSYFFNVMRMSDTAENGGRSGWGVKLDETNPDYKINLENVVFDNVIYQGKHVDSLETAKECNFYIDPGVDVKFK